MTGRTLWSRNTFVVVASLLVAGCSGGSSGSSGGGASSGTSPADNGSSGASSGSNAGGSSGGDGESDGGGTGIVGSMVEDGGREDATAVSDASSTKGGSTHDASSADGSSGDAGTADGGDALAAARAQCVQIINQDRATLKPASAPLVEDTAEEACVDGQAEADYQANTPHSAFGKCRESAQDECPNWPGPPSSIMTKCLAEMWAEGPPDAGQDNHWLNMSNAKYKKVACGFYQTPTGKWWATQDFY